ncbi:LuxR C-terminal-related transcriptional regulator [Streptomyces pathocidini]|uniref:LuxR C-terminal-related transcriptional regulator n=1 Tax=Streptomyces pathocidini TaxID=1650571 RepID=UPI0033CEFE1A
MPDTPLRGREEEIAGLAGILESCTGGDRTLIAIEGPPGAGKSRFLREALTVAERLGLSDLVIAVDNAQHLDEKAVNALVSGRRPPPCGTVNWILARRSVAGAPPLDGVLPNPVDRSERIALSALSHAAAMDMAADVLGARPEPELIRVLGRAGGHPRRLRELLDGMREEGSILVDGAAAHLVADRVPRSLVSRVESSLIGYSDAFRQMVRVAAALGAEISYDDLAAMLGARPSALLPVLDEVIAAGVLAHRNGRLAFQDELLRQLITDWMAPTVRQALSQQADALRREADALRGEPGSRAQPASLTDPSAAPGADARPAAPLPAEVLKALSEQEATIVALVRDGLTNQQIARRLGLSPHTVNYHLRKIFRLFEIGCRIDLIRMIQGEHRPRVPPQLAAEAPQSDRPQSDRPQSDRPQPSQPQAAAGTTPTPRRT